MKRPFLFGTVFVTGMCVTAVEMTASRLLAPYFGAWLFVWTSIIGVVLAALAIGYWLGGKLADRDSGKTAGKILFPIIFATGLAVTLIPFIGKPVFMLAYQAIPARTLSVFLAALLATLVLFTIPILLLGMVSPLTARIALTKMQSAGRTVGSLYAFSTLGSIVGTFLPVLLTIPFFGSRETFFIFGGILILLGAIGTARRALLLFLLLPVGLWLLPQTIHANPNIIFQDESVYNYIRVEEERDGTRILFTNEGAGRQSVYHPARVLTGFYWDAPAFLPLLNPNGKEFLIIGTAGATSGHVLKYFFPSLRLTGVEIDPLMVEVGRTYFDIGRIFDEIFLSDGRTYLTQTQKQYDFVMLDVYKDELYIPFHLATKEFFELVGQRLKPGGAMIMNVASVSENDAMLSLIKNTVTGAFPFVYELRELNSYNSLLFAFTAPPDFSKISLKNLPLPLQSLVSVILRGITPASHKPDQEVAVDNKSALEFLTEKMIFAEAI